MSNKQMIHEAERLELQAKKLRLKAKRKMPDQWRVGQKVRYVSNKDWAWNKGGIAYILELRDEYKGLSADEYQVFYTGSKKGSGTYWTTPDDVELIEE